MRAADKPDYVLDIDVPGFTAGTAKGLRHCLRMTDTVTGVKVQIVPPLSNWIVKALESKSE